MNIVPSDVLRRKRLQKTVSNTTADPVIELVESRLKDTTDRRPADWEGMTSEQQDWYAAGFWDAVPVIRQLLQQELVQWQEILNAYLWWRGDLGMTPLEKVLSRLHGVKPCGEGQYKALCPAHDDKNPSLSVTEAADGKVLIRCHAGCDYRSIVKAMGLETTELFPASNGRKPMVKRGQQQPEAVYDYHDERGDLRFQVVRFPGKQFRQRRPNGAGGWEWNLKAVDRVLYRLPEVTTAVKRGEQIFIVEGEKDADRLCSLGFIATTNAGGAGQWAGQWQDNYTEVLAGADVVIFPDNDEPGRKHGKEVAESLRDTARTVKVIRLPGLDDKGDVSDWLNAGGTADKLLQLVHEAPQWTPAKTPQTPTPDEVSEDEPDKLTQSQLLIGLAADAEFFHTPEDEAYATIPVSDHKETWPLRTKGFRRWLLQRFYTSQGKPPGQQALQDALGVLEAQAYFDGPELPIYSRLAELDDKIYLDLCDSAWEAVEIASTGWQVISNPPVKFRRSKGMLPLPKPQQDGSIDDLRQFVNVGDGESWRLLVGWLVAALRPIGPYPVLVLHGEQGSAKSTTARVLRSLVDPNVAPLRTTPRDERDLAIAAHNSWILSFDNLSGVPPWLSDALCRVATGGGFATRTLYEDNQETIFDYIRPVAVNGIDEIVTRHDLLDRSLVITLPVISDEKRQDEETFWAAFEEAQPRILGALLDAVSTGLARWESTKLDAMPRMADFARWVTAAEAALPWEAGGFMAAYAGNRSDAVSLALEADCVAVAITGLLEKRPSFEGTATELLETLESYVPEQTRNTRAWPKTPRTLSNRLRRAATFLRQTGTALEFDREPGGHRRRVIRLSRKASVPSVPSVPKGPGSPMYQGLQGGTQETQNRDATEVVPSPASRQRPAREADRIGVWDDRDVRDDETQLSSKGDEDELPW